MHHLRIDLDVADRAEAEALASLLLSGAVRQERRDPGRARRWQSLAAGISAGLRALESQADDLTAERLLAACGLTAPGPRPALRPAVQRPEDEVVDELAVERVVRGQQPYPLLTEPEAREAARQLTAFGASAGEIAERVGVQPRTVHRWRAEDRAAVAVAS